MGKLIISLINFKLTFYLCFFMSNTPSSTSSFNLSIARFPSAARICILGVGHIVSLFPSEALNFDYASLLQTERFLYLRQLSFVRWISKSVMGSAVAC